MFHTKFYRLIFASLMSLSMTFIMSGIITFLNLGLNENSLKQWLLDAFPKAWIIAFLIAFLIVPYIAKITEYLIKK